MGIFDRFPYSSTHEMNLDFMLGKATEIAESLQEIDTHKEQAEQAAQNAAQDAQAAAGSQTAAQAAQTAASASAAAADQHKTDAEDAADRAEAASNLADEAVEHAQTAANGAIESANAAETRINATATQAQTDVQAAANAATASATAAETRINTLAASLPQDFTDLNNKVNKNTLDINLIGYTQQHIFVPSGSSHSSANDILSIEIPAGEIFAITIKTNRIIHPQIYAIYSDGTSNRIYMASSSTYVDITIIRTAEKDIVGFGTYLSTTSADTTIDLVITRKNAMSGLLGYAYITPYYIRMPEGNLYFEEGRSRIDVDTIHQSIAVWNNQVWEFGEGKAAYNNVQYSLENGHANCCNWGTTLHGTYPYLYCPLMTNNNINVFSFDGTSFSLVSTIEIQTNLTGSLNAYIDEANGFIYGLITSTYLTYFVADMRGNILFSKQLMYKIPTIQNVKLYNGVLYIVSGSGTVASPNYLSIVSTDGTMLGRYIMGGIAEIEGIDFLDNKMILASYYNFYINPVLVPETTSYGYANQLKTTT